VLRTGISGPSGMTGTLVRPGLGVACRNTSKQEQTMSANTNPNRPTFLAYVITERTGKKNVWTPIGAAWPNRDAKGFTIQLHANPIDGKITLREPLPERDEDDEAEASRAASDRRAELDTDGDIPF
jgi:hypothetical protein